MLDKPLQLDICSWGQRGLNSNSAPPARVVFHTLLVKIDGCRAVLVWCTPVSLRAEVQSEAEQGGDNLSTLTVASDKHPMCFS